MSQNTAILIFTNTAKEEATSKQWLHNANKSNIKIAQKLIDKTINTAKKTQIPTFVIDSANQRGSNFGDKLSNAIADVFNLNYKNLIIIGSDCPKLSSSILLDAAEKLTTINFVIGADKRGGAYLIGLNKSSFDDAAFQKFAWQSKYLFTSLVSYVKSINASFSLLKVLNDFHTKLTHTSFSQLKSVVDGSFLYWLLATISSVKKHIIYVVKLLLQRIHSSKSLRAPPIFFV